MNPYLDKGNNPHVEVKVFLSKWTLIDCYLDTGFSGGISLPNKYRNLFLSRKPLSFQRFLLADGSIKQYPIYETKVKYKNKEKPIIIFFSPNKDALVGIEFLLGFKFVLDLKKFKVSLE
ncbi:hypothetical protein A3A46_02320 [Candidatus Roizmanbacteria bacterium RIFCSPLOWO2_01_FULL_37_13]|uniref:Uncharacterized protein n=1 Tax=Candidatus Roizmanbacteria bacterium RIFCSPHIGHO2_02_FULL_38_11 TaxID=1802039 RepID=A0A1F7H367_9BACT|nr:MAG: hypothetical protein A3C25_03720 [Candidatus Roizmanbacteria bacterium RIFCSPHIGHO2_02_FULL_38_11]OGK35305.1 MAG: hypothetical protein A3F58_03375 [Candidatus Roizmanbacteria bacterium RIFCSPHIGHO2_12_FULL_37_9b]OGK41413.1 MAG: hypothetical protein A3A46_02320 [Candidatus Roizmanbacteria bacterium RIFCSPLOWO2_01_FULL_37_13]